MIAMPASSRKAAHPASPSVEGGRRRPRSHEQLVARRRRSVMFFALGILVGLTVALLLVMSGRVPGSSGQSAERPANFALDPLGGKGCRKRMFDNQTGQITEESCETAYAPNGKPGLSADRVNAVRRWFKP
jgi:hypothetical protein